MYRFKLLVVVFLLSAIYTQAQIQVIPINESNFEIKSSSTAYCLPQISFEISISLTTERLIPGPYSKYAEKYLSIRNSKSSEEINYYIDTIIVNERISSDPNACFFVTGGAEDKIKISNEGIILAYNVDNYQAESIVSNQSFSATNISHISLPNFTDYGVKPNFINNTDTTYKVVEVDSVFQKIPIYNKVIISKDDEMKADEAANYILSLRNCLYKVLSGDFDTDVPPSEIEFMVSELKRLESEYLSLFIGKIEKTTRNYTFYYTPKSSLVNENVNLCYLENGKLLEQSTSNSRPIVLKLSNSTSISNIANFYSNNSGNLKEKTKGLYYRLPSEVAVSLVFDDFTYYQSRFFVPQCGLIKHLPANIFKDKYLQIEFDSKYGTIKKKTTK